MENEITYIKIWTWQDAPAKLRELSRNGGDEDWVALIPPNLKNRYIPWMNEGTSFGCCSVDTISHPDLGDYTVKIGSHA